MIDAAGANYDWNKSWVGDTAYIRNKIAEASESGTTEIIYNPAGPDPLREIEAFAKAAIG